MVSAKINLRRVLETLLQEITKPGEVYRSNELAQYLNHRYNSQITQRGIGGVLSHSKLFQRIKVGCWERKDA